jgi:hypothetical protein
MSITMQSAIMEKNMGRKRIKKELLTQAEKAERLEKRYADEGIIRLCIRIGDNDRDYFLGLAEKSREGNL